MECRKAIASTMTLMCVLSCGMHSVRGIMPAWSVSFPGLILIHRSPDPLRKYLLFGMLAATPLGEALKREGSANGIETTTTSIEDGLKGIEAILAIGSALPVENGTTLAEPGNSLEATVQLLKKRLFSTYSLCELAYLYFMHEITCSIWIS